ncbi:hypothetical protein [Ekhidna sp.]|uniref:hypothetical protein n=1 Tax=Ekhidna sp. TaxID=2608089 RepID=UPI0032974D6F
MLENDHIARLFSASQRTLSSLALDPSTVKIDDRSSTELLSFMAELAKQFWYYNEDGRRDGDWSDFFQTDMVSLLAVISESYSENDYRIILGFIESIEKLSGKSDVENAGDLSIKLWELFHLAFKPIFKINDWYKTFTRLHVDTQFQTYLKELIWSKLSFGLRDLYAFYYFSIQAGVLTDKEKIDNEFKKFQDLDVLWNFNPFPNIRRSKVEMFDFFENNKAFLNGLRESVKGLHNQQKAIAKKANDIFYVSLNTKQTEPHIALILGFLKAYKLQQDAINNILPKYLDFYYKDLLKFEKKGAVGDDVFIAMKLSKGNDVTNVSSSTQLLAGTDSAGEPILFETQKSLQVTPSIISDYLTLIIDKSSATTEVLSSHQVKGFSAPVISKQTGLYESFQMFGGIESTNVAPITSAIGFAISSPELFLEGGKRCVEILFLNKETAPTKSADSAKLKETLLDNLVELKVTGTKGWITPDYQEIRIIGGKLRIRFGLKKSNASIVSYNEKTHGKGYDAQWPITVLTLKNQSDSNGLNPYAELGKISFSSYQIRTTTKELSILSLITNTGKAASTAIVAPFGGNPSLGSQLTIGCQEVFVKHTKLFKVKINWLNLPVFWKYYFVFNEYQVEHLSAPTFFKKNFKCALSWLDSKTGKWETSAEDVQLFNGNDDGTSFASKCGHPFNPKKEVHAKKAVSKNTDAKSPLTPITYTYDVAVTPDYSLKSPLIYTDKSSSGFMSLELTGPEESFGNNLYPKIISQVTLENTIKAAKKAKSSSPAGKNGPSSQLKQQKLNKPQSASVPVQKVKSGIKNWFKKIWAGIGKFVKKLGPTLKVVKKVAAWINKNILKHLGTVGKLIYKGLSWLGKTFKKTKTANVFKPLPNKPYVPKIKGVTIDYCSSLQVVPGSDSENKLFKIHPFGIEEMNASERNLLPQYQASGYAFLGFTELDMGTTLSIFLGVEDLKQTTVSGNISKVNVEVLGTENWECVKVIEDSTLGLKKAGILRVYIDKKPEVTNPIMPLKSYWLRLSASDACVKNCKLRMIATNAVLASRVIDEKNATRCISNLNAGKISKLVVPIPAISKIEQPFPSFGGENPENDSIFNKRVAKRISNKDRGVSITYIESIILDSFPEIYQVNVYNSHRVNSTEPNVRISVLPLASQGSQIDPYHPVASVNLLNKVRLLLQSKTSPHVRLEVEHMKFDKVLVSLDAVFTDPDAGRVYQEELNADLKDFLSPWIEGNNLTHTQSSLYINDLLQFISSRTYVASFENLKIINGDKPVYGIFHGKEDDVVVEYTEQRLFPTGPLHVLASADRHLINDVSIVAEEHNQPEPVEATI